MTNQEWIYKIVHAFYEKAKHDVLIGYHFRNIQDFDEHIPRIAAFWEIQLLGGTSRQLKDPFDVMKAHLPLGIKYGELGRWLLLFRQTLEHEKDHDELLFTKWKERLDFFEGVFKRYFGF